MREVYHLYDDLENFAFNPAGREMCLYGDPAYPLRFHVQAPFRYGFLTRQMQVFNEAMSAVRPSAYGVAIRKHHPFFFLIFVF